MEQMTDAEVNLAIAKIEFVGKELYQCGNHVDVRLGAGDYTCVDYCNNWEDIGPIIEREGISVYRWRNHWKAVCPNENHHIFSETPMKAAALCYLQMKESE